MPTVPPGHPRPATVPDDCPPYSIPPDGLAAIDAWLADVRSLAPLTQPTAYQLARALCGGTSSVVTLTRGVASRLGPNPAVWEQDMADLYRQGLLAMWAAVGSPTSVMLMRNVRASSAVTDRD